MGEMVDFTANGKRAIGYLAKPGAGAGPGVIVIQEWWGLVPHIKDVADRFAAAGFVALAPDLYHGEETTEPDEAAKKMMAMDLQRAAQDMSDAVDYLLSLEACTSKGVGAVGFCMGGGLVLWLASVKPEVAACVPFYGAIPWEEVQPDYSGAEAAFLGHYGSADDWANPELARSLETQLHALGKEATMHIYAGGEHAFFNDDRPEVYHAKHAQTAWERTIDFLWAQLES